MATLLTDSFANETGITKVTPSFATVTNSANTEIITLSQATTFLEGFYGNSSVTVNEEDNLFYSFKTAELTNNYVSVGASRASESNFGAHYMVAQTQGSSDGKIRAVLWGSFFGVQVTASVNTQYYFLNIYGSQRQAIYYNLTGYSATLTDWTLLSTIPDGVADVGQAMRFVAFLTTGDAGTSVTVYPYTFRDNADLVINNAPIPTNLAATAIIFHTVRLTFTDNGTLSTQTSIKIERSTVGGGVGFSEIGSVANGVGTFDATGLTAATQYFFRIRSDFSFGAIHHYSNYTSEVNVTTSAVAGGITGGSYSEYFLVANN